MKDHFNTFFAKWNGKPCEVSDPSNLNQCMDLAFAWCDEIGVPRTTIGHLYASQVYTAPNDITIKYFELVPNTALGVPQIGDLVVFKGGTAGHISISNGVGDTNTFQSFDQNFGSTVNKCGIIIHPYDNVLGFLRFRSVPNLIITDQTVLPIIDANGNKMEVQAVRSALAAQESQIADLLTRSDNYLKEIADLQSSQTALNAKITALQAKVDNIPTPPNLLAIHDTYYGSGFWWTKWAKIGKLLPR
jgi:hypothetical protein